MFFIWCALQASIFTYGFLTQKYNTDLAVLNKIGLSVLLSRGAGLCLAVLPVFVILPMCKKTMSFLSNYCTKLPEILQQLHVLAAYTLAFFAAIHSVSHYVNFYVIDQNRIINSTISTIHHHTIAGITGHVMIVSLFIVFIFSANFLIREKYNTFIVIHSAYLFYFTAFMIHGTGCFVRGVSGKCYPYYSSAFAAVPMAIFVLERLHRVIFTPTVFTTSTTNYSDGVKITTKRNFDYIAGQYVFVNFPEVSKYYWHPITISSCPLLSLDTIGLSIKDVGDWTKSVRELCASKGVVQVRLDGPYYSPCRRHTEFDNVIFVCSGIGITPFLSIIKDFAMQYMSVDYMFAFNRKIDIYWVSRNRQDIIWFEEIFSDLAFVIPAVNLNIMVFITDPNLDEIGVKDLSLGRNPGFDNLTDSKVLINYMRPDLNKLFSKYSYNNLNSKVGVFICANEGLTSDTIRTAEKFSNKNVSFECIVEKF